MKKPPKDIFDARDVHVYSGILLALTGTWALIGPAALIVPGVALFYLGARRV
ncbi:MAG: hypothetical protein AAF389_14830 [Gemmatimonadota bacterium]